MLIPEIKHRIGLMTFGSCETVTVRPSGSNQSLDASGADMDNTPLTGFVF